MKVIIEETALPMRMLLIEPDNPTTDTPILLYLHGKGEASPYENALPLVCNHLSPPFQAMLGRLVNVIVVAPQAPYDPEKDKEKKLWNWRTHLAKLGRFFEDRFPQRQILATGFSRGGLGVLQLRCEFPNLITKWAIVDPQRGANDAEEIKLLPVSSPDKQGWLRYGTDMNHQFSRTLSDKLASNKFVALSHREIALAAYQGDKLEGPENLYEFLGLTYK